MVWTPLRRPQHATVNKTQETIARDPGKRLNTFKTIARGDPFALKRIINPSYEKDRR